MIKPSCCCLTTSRLCRRVCWNATALLAALLIASSGCQRAVDPATEVLALNRPTSEVAITTFCGSCHVFPPPSSFPRRKWRHEVEQGLQIYADSGRSDLTPTDLEATVAWFESYAPEDYIFAKEDVNPIANDRFERVELSSNEDATFPKTSHVRALESGAMLLSEVYTGYVHHAKLDGKTVHKKPISRIADPVHAEPTDLDGDGVTDYVVADIGFINPNTQRFGTLWWIRPVSGLRDDDVDHQAMNGWETIPLKTGYSRICDARPIDYDQDGDQDLVVAEFGFIREGSVQLLTNVGLENGIPKFESKVVDDRNGASHVPVVDLNQDGLMDFLTLVSQEHETIEVHMNQGGGDFERKLIYAAADPAYASSGLEVVDLDSDGDLDVLYTNGDTFDDHTAKPFHSVQWLENEGEFPFTHHHLTSMPGVYCAVAGDVDRDGDMDIAAVALISPAYDANDQGPESDARREIDEDNRFDGAIWLEQTERRQFVRHRIIAGQCEWATCELMDIDHDSDLDLVLGRYVCNRESPEAIALFRNLTTDAVSK